MPAKRVQCPRCDKPFGALEQQFGQSVYCPHCGHKVKLPALQGQDLQAEVAAQLAAPPPDEAAGQAHPTPPDRATDEAAKALEQALGAPEARQPARPPTYAHRATSRPGGHAAAGHHGATQAHPRTEESSSIVVARKKDNTALILISVFGVCLVGVVLAIIYIAASGRVVDKTDTYASAPATPATAVSSRSGNPGARTPGVNPRLAPGAQPDAASATDAQLAELPKLAPGEEAVPLTFKKEGPELFYEPKPGSVMNVLICSLESNTDEPLRRVSIGMLAQDKEDGKQYAGETNIFCDMKPKEKIYYAFEFPDVKGREVQWGKSRIAWGSTQTRPYEFEVTVKTITPDGAKSGVISYSVTNHSVSVARVVNIFFVLRDARRDPSGYAKTQVMNLTAGECRDVKTRWEHWFKEGVQYADGRAQIGGEEEQ